MRAAYIPDAFQLVNTQRRLVHVISHHPQCAPNSVAVLLTFLRIGALELIAPDYLGGLQSHSQPRLISGSHLRCPLPRTSFRSRDPNRKAALFAATSPSSR